MVDQKTQVQIDASRPGVNSCHAQWKVIKFRAGLMSHRRLAELLTEVGSLRPRQVGNDIQQFFDKFSGLLNDITLLDAQYR